MDRESLIASFRQRGFVVLQAALSRDIVETIRRKAADAFELEPWVDPHFTHPPGTDLYAMADKRWKRLEEVLGDLLPLTMNARVCDFLKRVMDDQPVLLTGMEPFRTSPSIRTPRAGEPGRDPLRNAHVHSFSHFLPEHGAVMGWFALEDIAAGAGPMWIEPGSHVRNTTLFDDVIAEQPELGFDLADLRASGAPYPEWSRWMLRMQPLMTELLERRIDEGAGERVPVLLKAGDLLLFDNALTHGTTVPVDRNATRWSLLARYQGLQTREYGWPSWLETWPYEPAIKHLPPVAYEVVSCGQGWAATNFDAVYDAMFWTAPLTQRLSE